MMTFIYESKKLFLRNVTEDNNTLLITAVMKTEKHAI